VLERLKSLKQNLVYIFIAVIMASCGPAATLGVPETIPPGDVLAVTVVSSSPTASPLAATATEILLPARDTSVPQPSATPTQEKIDTPTPSPSAASLGMTPTAPEPTAVYLANNSKAIIVDHRSVELFERIPEEYLNAARNLPMLFADRSVGKNIDDALNCLTAEAWHLSRAYCRNDYYDTSSVQWLNRTFNLDDFQNGSVPATILFEPHPVLYDRSNWTFDIAEGEWEDIVRMFVEDLVPEYIGEKDVLSFQFNYFNIRQGSNIADTETGFFVDLPHEDFYRNRLRWDIGSIEELEEKYPDKVFFYWTTSLARGIGSEEGEIFNNQLREYVLANDKVLFDVAAILSHDPEGKPCFDNRDGIEYCNNNRCENHPDDGKNYPAICQAYTTETDGGHLGSVSGGGLRVAKAFWVLMAKIAGWEG
jgi:hypothetical protein